MKVGMICLPDENYSQQHHRKTFDTNIGKEKAYAYAMLEGSFEEF